MGSAAKRRFSLTNDAVRIVVDPNPKSEKVQSALRKAALAPKIHAEIWEKYGAAAGLDLVLQTYLTLDRREDGQSPFTEKAAQEFIDEYRETINFAGIASDAPPLDTKVEPAHVKVEACEEAKKSPRAFQLGDPALVAAAPYRGVQPLYADDDEDPETLEYEGMVLSDGSSHPGDNGQGNVCALKSISVRWGYVDFGAARSVARSFYEKKKHRASVISGDLLINSTGDGTIGRVAVFNRNFPAVVDGHITIVRFHELEMAWYTAAYLLSQQGQRQIYRYINGSSGQVEIYPQDIARLWIPRKTPQQMKDIAKRLKTACEKHDAFFKDMREALSLI